MQHVCARACMILRYDIVMQHILKLHTSLLHSIYLAGTVFGHTVPVKGWPAGQYVYVVYTYTYASLYTSSYLYKILLACVNSYM